MSEEAKSAKDDIGFMVSIQKQSMLSGEIISVSTNLPTKSTSEDIRKTIELITQAIDWRIPQNQGIVDQAILEGLAKQSQELT